MKLILLAPFIYLCLGFSSELDDSRTNIEKETLIVSKGTSYFCVANKNFLPCINSNIELDSDSCMKYVFNSSRKCDEKLVRGADFSISGSMDKIAVEYLQCSLLEMINKEHKSYKEFEVCLNESYSKKNVHPVLNRVAKGL